MRQDHDSGTLLANKDEFVDSRDNDMFFVMDDPSDDSGSRVLGSFFWRLTRAIEGVEPTERSCRAKHTRGRIGD